jgi:hypothetical protein
MNNERGTEERIRDPKVDAAWRAASTEEPAPQADASILAAAREGTRSREGSTDNRHASNRWIRWQSLAAAAGLAGLAFVVIQRLPNEPAATRTLEAPVRATPGAAAKPEAEAGAGVRSTLEAPTVPQSVEQSPDTFAPAKRLSSQERTEDLATAPVLPSAAPPAREQAAGMAADRSEIGVPGPDDWVKRIVALHEAGNLPAAADALRALRRAYPDADARLPAGLHEWASTVDSGVER